MIQISKRGQVVGPNVIYCGRGTALGNPFIMGKHGDRNEVCDMFAQYFYGTAIDQEGVQQQLQLIRDAISEYGNVFLECHCAPLRCHTETIRDYLIANNGEPLKLIVAGGRDFNDYERLSAAIISVADMMVGHSPGKQVAIVSGMARGADDLAVRFARNNTVKLYEMPADWDTYGKSAGYRRNINMSDVGDAALVFWDGKSRGTRHMITTMHQLGKPVYEERY